jgi:DNA-binding transcriptional regulator YdaS (Cro superfamily)
MRSVRENIDIAIASVGGQRELARRCGVSAAAISLSVKRGHVSMRLAIRIEQATDGKVTARDLLPELFDRPAS